MKSDKPVALVTGAARRLGRAIASSLADAGYKVAIHYRTSEAEARDLEKEITAKYGDGAARLFRADLSDTDAVLRLPNEVCEEFGRLNLLVNNASLFEKSVMEHVTPEAIEKYHATHVLAPAALSIEAAGMLREACPGRIVNIVDVFADYPKKGYLPYTISKAGLKALTRQLAVELAPEVLVNAVAPGAILEPIDGGSQEMIDAIVEKIPLKRFGKPEDITKAVLFFAETEYVTGHTMVVDGGRSLNI